MLYAAGIPEHLIQQHTGHRSIEALRLYERPTQQQQRAVSDVLASTSVKSYTEAMVPHPATPTGPMPTATYKTSSPSHPAQSVPPSTSNFSVSHSTTTGGIFSTEDATIVDKLFAGVDSNTFMSDI